MYLLTFKTLQLSADLGFPQNKKYCSRLCSRPLASVISYPVLIRFFLNPPCQVTERTWQVADSFMLIGYYGYRGNKSSRVGRFNSDPFIITVLLNLSSIFYTLDARSLEKYACLHNFMTHK